jgi:1,4-dihydroxy-6-naphthoate synthase
MILTLGISPCPNDTIIFDALLNGKIDNEGLQFEYILEDVETLNKMAEFAKLDVTKVSYGAVHNLLSNYRILDAGGALGKGVGPLLVSKKPIQLMTQQDNEISVVLPGENTTAHLLFSLAYQNITKKTFLPFNEIEKAVLEGRFDTGVIIHENRFTYAEKGLTKLADLGDIWESQTNLPIPLGGILSRRKFELEINKKINRVIHRSLTYAFKHLNEELPAFVSENAQEMNEDVMRKHIALYVNEFSLGLGSHGKNAVIKLLETSVMVHGAQKIDESEIFIV